MTAAHAIVVRAAHRQDAPAAAPLIHSAGPQALGYLLGGLPGSPQSFLAHCFEQPEGFFGWRTHRVACIDGEVVGVVAGYDRASYWRHATVQLWRVWHRYPWSSQARLLLRQLQLQGLMPPPRGDRFYVANLGVGPQWRSRGVGRALLASLEESARAAGLGRLALDVSVENPRAQALYARCGFQVVERNRFTGPAGAVPDTLRMERVLPPS